MVDPFYVPQDLEYCAVQVIQHYESLPEELRKRLENKVDPLQNKGNQYGSDFSLTEEVNEMLKMARALRKDLMVGDFISDDATTRDVKEAVSASNTLLNTIIKSHGQLMSFERQRAIEKAVVDSVMYLPDEQKTNFFKVLEKNLEKIS
jgi:hypothetical protein